MGTNLWIGYRSLFDKSSLRAPFWNILLAWAGRWSGFRFAQERFCASIEMKSNAEKRTEGLDKFRKLFNPQAAFIVGDGGISAEDFLSMDVRKLFWFISFAKSRKLFFAIWDKRMAFFFVTYIGDKFPKACHKIPIHNCWRCQVISLFVHSISPTNRSWR